MTNSRDEQLEAPQQPAASPSVRCDYATDVSIIIVSFNTRAMLARALTSIYSSAQRSTIQVIVVDNASRDGSLEMIRDQFPGVVCVANDRNLGHSTGCNQGMLLASGRYFMLLNSDTVMQAGAIDVLATYLDEHSQVGAVGPRVLNADGTIQGTVKQFPTPWAAIFGRFSIITRLWPRNRFSRSYLIYLDQNFQNPFAVDSASGAALMVRREAVEVAGLLDQRFFLYWNDVDWCRSIWRGGFEVHCVPESVLKHEEHHGGSRAGVWQRLKTIVNFHRGAYLYYYKWHVRQFWQPLHFVAIVGLTLRATLVILFEQLNSVISLGKKLLRMLKRSNRREELGAKSR